MSCCFPTFINDYAKLVISEHVETEEIYRYNHERFVLIRGISVGYEASFVISIDYVDVEGCTSNIPENRLPWTWPRCFDPCLASAMR